MPLVEMKHVPTSVFVRAINNANFSPCHGGAWDRLAELCGVNEHEMYQCYMFNVVPARIYDRVMKIGGPNGYVFVKMLLSLKKQPE